MATTMLPDGDHHVDLTTTPIRSGRAEGLARVTRVRTWAFVADPPPERQKRPSENDGEIGLIRRRLDGRGWEYSPTSPEPRAWHGALSRRRDAVVALHRACPPPLRRRTVNTVDGGDWTAHAVIGEHGAVAVRYRIVPGEQPDLAVLSLHYRQPVASALGPAGACDWWDGACYPDVSWLHGKQVLELAWDGHRVDVEAIWPQLEDWYRSRLADSGDELP
jgi:hypothetical protein